MVATMCEGKVAEERVAGTNENSGVATSSAGSLLEKFLGSIELTDLVRERLQASLADRSISSVADLILVACKGTYEEAKLNEKQRIVPFGVRFSESLSDPGPHDPEHPVTYNAGFTTTTTLFVIPDESEHWDPDA